MNRPHYPPLPENGVKDPNVHFVGPNPGLLCYTRVPIQLEVEAAIAASGRPRPLCLILSSPPKWLDVQRCAAFAAAWHCGPMRLVALLPFLNNLSPNEARVEESAAFRINRGWLDAATRITRDEGGIVVVAWGDDRLRPARYRRRRRGRARAGVAAEALLGLHLDRIDLKMIGLTRSGWPRHPLRAALTPAPLPLEEL